MIRTTCRIIAITPVYEDLEASSQLFKELSLNFGKDIFVVAVDDGSVKSPLRIEKPVRIRG
jgi:hypothetical protein